MSGIRQIARLGVSVAAVRESDGAFLLVKRGRPPAKDMWAYAGGKVEFAEALAEAARRELLEETGIDIDTAVLSFLRPVEIVMRDGDETVSHFVLMCFQVAVADLQPVAGDDALKAHFFTLAQMRTLDLTPTTLEIAEEISTLRQ